MKTKTVLLLFFIFNGYCSYSQPYKSVFGKDTTQWNVKYQTPDYPHTLVYKAYTDTSINNKSYKYLYKGNQWLLGNVYGYLREDTITGKLWLLTPEKTEQLIMDLSLTKNDTFLFETGVKYTVDTVFHKFGRRYISFNRGSKDSILFIEGIGPFNFLYSPEVWKPAFAQIRCMLKDNVLIFKNSLFVACFDTATRIINKQVQSVDFYPNPVKDFIIINTNVEKLYTMELYDNIGNLNFKEIITNNETINLSYLPKGLYIVRLKSNFDLFIFKLIKL